MYSKDVLRKYHDGMESAIAFYARFPVESLQICISLGNMKIGNVPNVSLPADFTCPHCEHCTKACYDKKACIQYKNVMNARARNYSILTRNYELYWAQLRAWLKKYTGKFFRFHVSGDITTTRYLGDMVKTARMFPNVRFWTYTKALEILNEYTKAHGGSRRKACPENLTIQVSRWADFPVDNPYGYSEYICIPAGMEPPKGIMKCPGNCKVCCDNKIGCPYGQSAWIYEH